MCILLVNIRIFFNVFKQKPSQIIHTKYFFGVHVFILERLNCNSFHQLTISLCKPIHVKIYIELTFTDHLEFFTMLSASWSTNAASSLTVILCSGGLAGAASAVKTQKRA